MIYILIRTCVRDDYIGLLAYQSMKKIYPDAKYVFLAEQPTVDKSYNYTFKAGVQVSFRPFCDNFGGQSGVHNILSSMKKLYLNVNDGDYVFLVDSDIVAFTSVLSQIQSYDHCGVMDERNSDKILHVSGQFQIMSGRFFNILMSFTIEDIHKYINEMLYGEISIADDTFISYISDKFKLKKKYVREWVHWKMYKYTGNLNFYEIIEDISLHRASYTL
jgi:hypothetical protein